MTIGCPRCGHLLSFADIPPRFCSHCGLPLSSSAPAATLPALAPTPEATIATPPDDLQATRAMPSGTGSRSGVPLVVGGYRLLRMLGGGGMGSVYEAEEQTSGRRVAIKLIRAEFADSPDAVERFRREGRLASTIQHSRCVFVLAADEEAGRPFIVMELMPGQNLQDRVDSVGRLAIPVAVGHILDIIEGLEEAHRCGVVHRDVKPSNCFVDADGRVKVGDFGLAKSLLTQQALTRSGAFLGTLLFASPEQIRNDHVDHLTDVYSVCATLYFLLTGQAPFHDGDAAATLARTVSEPAPSMRTLWPEIPRTLDEVVLRGLERQRRKRWQSLEELRLALVPFVAPEQCQAGLGSRISAYVIDLVFRAPLEVIAGLVLATALGLTPGDPQTQPVGAKTPLLFVASALSLLWGLLYFSIPEALWGCSPGKFFMRLRVRDEVSGDRPRLWQSVERTAWFYFFKDGLTLLARLGVLALGGQILADREATLGMRTALASSLFAVPALAGGLGILLLGTTMRRRNGLRAIHEWLSGTRLIRLPWTRPRFRVGASAWPAEGLLPAGVPRRVGGFHVHTLAGQTALGQVFHAEEETLRRPVWLWLRGVDAEPLPRERREAARPGRPRWLAGGIHEGKRWDAFVAAAGQPLLSVLSPRGPLGWLETMTILEQLAEELLAASRDGTLPDRLSPQQVWLLASGQVLLLDAPPAEGESVETPLDLLRQVAATALEGQLRSTADLARPIQAPVPGPASTFLARLIGIREPLESLEQVFLALDEVREEPAEISRPARALQVAVNAVLLGPGLFCLFALGPILVLLGYVTALLGQANARDQIEVYEADPHIELVAEVGCIDMVARVDPLGKVVAGGMVESVREQRRRLYQQLRDLDREKENVLGAWSVFVANRFEPFDEPFQLAVSRRKTNRARGRSLLAPNQQTRVERPSEWAREELQEPLTWLLWLAAWPALWIVWAYLTRGGLARRVPRIALVGRDGRPAARWRCAWRVLLVWLPVLLLLHLSTLLDLSRFAYGAGWDETLLLLVAWSAWGLWWLAVLLLPVYAYRAVSAPRRGLHDRLAGVYSVPG